MHRSEYLPVLAALMVASAGLQASEIPSLVKPEGKDYRTMMEPVHIRFPDPLKKNVLETLRFEIDYTDVTDFVTHAANVFTYIPAEPLVPGHHEIRVISLQPDGSIEEIGNWAFEVRHSENFLEASVEQNLDIQAMHGIKDSFSTPQDDSTVQGTWSFNTIHSDNNWRVSSQADFLYNQKTDQTFRGEEFDVNEYLLKAELPQTTLQLGHHDVGMDSLILSQFNRRGISARVESEDKRFDVTGFSMRTESIAGFHHGLGFSDNSSRTSGVVLNSFPVTSDPDLLALSAVYLSGNGAEEGIDQISDDVTNSGGDAVALIADSRVMDRTLRFRAEVAQTSYDFDGKNTGTASKDDGAYSFLVHYTPHSEGEYSWDAGIKFQKVSPWFHSPGYSEIASDQDETQIFANLNASQWGINTILSRKYDNVDEDNTLPEVKSDLVTAQLYYNPVMETEYDGFMGIFSNPGYTLTLTRGRNEQENQPAGFLGQETNTMNREMSFQANFSSTNWSWSFGHGIVMTDDNTDVSSDTRNRLTTLDMMLPAGEKASLGLQLQRNEQEDLDTGVDTNTNTAGISMTINHPVNWTTVISHTMNRERASNDSVDTRSHITEASMRWDYVRASGNKPGVAFFMNANYQTTDNDGDKTGDYQAFLGINITWAAKY